MDAADALTRHLAGDPAAFEALIRQFGGAVRGLLSRYGLTPEERDDVFQEVFLRVHRSAASWRGEHGVKPWLFAIAVNTARSWLTRKRPRELRESTPASQRLVDPAPLGAEVVEAREFAGWLSQELDRLPLEQREVVVLCGVHQLPMADAAFVLMLPVGTIKSRLRRGRLALAEALERRDATERREVGA
jgi:RNA polymerase sigma-70 factor, ECF subfamily